MFEFKTMKYISVYIYYHCTGNLAKALRESIGNSLLVTVNEITQVNVFQVLASMTLIYLALADYIGSKGEEEERMRKTIVSIRGEEVVTVEEFQDIDSVTKECKCNNICYFFFLILSGVSILGILYMAGQYNSSNIVNPTCTVCSNEEISNTEVTVNVDMTINEEYTGSYR